MKTWVKILIGIQSILLLFFITYGYQKAKQAKSLYIEIAEERVNAIEWQQQANESAQLARLRAAEATHMAADFDLSRQEAEKVKEELKKCKGNRK